jgi:hypothetical protein
MRLKADGVFRVGCGQGLGLNGDSMRLKPMVSLKLRSNLCFG